MTQDDIIRIAREAGFREWENTDSPDFLAVIQRFATLVVAAERESCVQIVENIATQYTEPTWAYQILRAIRHD